ncbi:MAG: hypothetical protein QM817_26395 [Archangium sp.]
MLNALRFAALMVLFTLSACGNTRGADCNTDSDCGAGLECISPGCATSQKKCAYTCKTTDDCHRTAGANDRCVKPNADCIAYCTPG